MAGEEFDDGAGTARGGGEALQAGLVELLSTLDEAMAHVVVMSESDEVAVSDSLRAQAEGFEAERPDGPGGDSAAVAGSGGEAAENRSIRHARALGARADARELARKLTVVRRGLENALDPARSGQTESGRRPESAVEGRSGSASGTEGMAASRGGPPGAVGVQCGGLSDPDRLAVLAESGLGPRSDARMEWFAERVRRRLGVPTALVSLVRAEEQVFPGAAGLPRVVIGSRRTPLTQSFCQYVAATGEPLVVRDARADPVLARSLAIPQLGVVAYAGMPLTDESGYVLGSLCAIDGAPRAWSDADLDALSDLAEGCSTELRLRLARADAAREREQRDRLQLSLHDSYERSQMLLEISRSVGDSASVEDVRAGLTDLAGGVLGADYVALFVLDHDVLRLLVAPDRGREQPSRPALALDERSPAVSAVRERRVVACPSREDFAAEFGASAEERLVALGLHATVTAPVLGRDGVVGALVLGWDRAREFSPADLLLVTTVAAYTARAIDHVGWVQHRVRVAREMQQAMLSELPDVPALRAAARYEPADAREFVGGDWYDVLPLPDPQRPDDTVVVISVGDIVGHELGAAIDMGQVRSMLRQAAWDHPGGPPSLIAHAFETASTGVGLDAAGTAVLAHLRRDETGAWSMAWINAGHPAPILVHADGSTELLDEHGRWFGLPRGRVEPRHDHQRSIPPGSVVVFYTDGLIERRDADVDERTEALRTLLADHAAADVDTMVSTVMARFGRGAGDDVVVLAARLT